MGIDRFGFRVVRVVRGECGFFNCPCGGTVSLAEPKERIEGNREPCEIRENSIQNSLSRV